MKTRIISGVAMLPLLVVVFLGGYVIKICALILSIMALIEFFKIHKYDGLNPSLPIAVGSTVLLYLFNVMHFEPVFYMLWLFLSVVACLLYSFKIEKRITEDSVITMTGIVYIVFFLFHMAWMADFDGYRIYIWMVIITAFVTDIAAYFSGRFLGRRKLCPNISPKKTVEGAIGGIAVCAILSLVYGLIFTEGLWFHCLFMGIIGSIAAQAGDLTASIFKRNTDVKDYGNLIPGHGGVMDRIDSILFTAPVIFWYVQLFLL